jgi:hypothetical protein
VTRISIYQKERWNILCQLAARTDERMWTDAHELMDANDTPNRRPISNFDMTSQVDTIGYDYSIAKHTIVCHMRICHQQATTSDSCHATLTRTPIQCSVFPNRRVGPYFQPGQLTPVLEVLWVRSEDRAVEDFAAVANARIPLNKDVPGDLHTASNIDAWTDDRVRTYRC